MVRYYSGELTVILIRPKASIFGFKVPDSEFSNLSVLLIEDEPMLNDLLEAYLQQIGVLKIVKSHNGKEALVQLSIGNIKPDLILCDLKMPVMDGFQFLEVLRGEHWLEFKGTPVLVLTGSKDVASLNKAIELGIHGYLVKPVMINDLISRMKYALSSPVISLDSIAGK